MATVSNSVEANHSDQTVAASPDLNATSSLSKISERRQVSIGFLRKEIERGRLRAVVLGSGSHRKKLRVFYKDELAWLNSCVAHSVG